MIRRKNENWFRMLFIWNGSVLPQVLPRLGLLFILSTLIVFLKGTLLHYKIPLNPAPFTLFGIALALFLGFRNNVSYDRFWEGRKLWGSLLNTTRSLTRQVISLSGYPTNSQEVLLFVNYLTAFTYALKHQLRETDATEDLRKILPAALMTQLKEKQYLPILLMREMAGWVAAARESGRLDSISQKAFDENFDKLSEIVGGCERIVSTPIPFSYRVLLHRTVYIYCFMLPFGFVDSLQWLTPIIVTFIAYTFVALEAIAEEIENPFGTRPNCLALDALSHMIEKTISEMIDRQIPGQSEPDSHILT
jgi:putative membrane protein